jgi:hypothetical protein
MGNHTATKTGMYLYAVATGAGNGACAFSGIDGKPVYTISDGRVSAVVSELSNEKIRPERRHLAAHQEVLKRLMEKATVLPMAFGIIADGPRTIQRILSQNQGAFVEQLHRVVDKVEMGLRVTWDVPNIFEYFVNSHDELRAARDRLLGNHREPAQEDKIELGRMFDRMLNEDRDSCADKVEKLLRRCCHEIKRNKCRSEREAMNLACLVGRQAIERFEAGVFEAAKLFDNNFAFDYNGPWAPHNFVDMNLQL